MTDEQIIKNLECCMESECDNCQYQYDTACKEYIFHDCLSLIHNLMNKNKALQHYYDECLKDLKNANAEIERLEETKNRLSYNLQAVLDERADHSEAVKEFAERYERYLLSQLTSASLDKKEWINFCLEELDNLKKEMVGEG